MHAKEEGIIRALKEISKMESEVAKKAVANAHMDVATHTMIVAKVTAEAAKIIEDRVWNLRFSKLNQSPDWIYLTPDALFTLLARSHSDTPLSPDYRTNT